MEKTKTSRFALGTNFTMPCANDSKNWKNFFVDKKNAKAVHTKYVRFGAKQDLKNGLITEDQYKEILRQLSFNKI